MPQQAHHGNEKDPLPTNKTGGNWALDLHRAETEGFEPSEELPLHDLSRVAH